MNSPTIKDLSEEQIKQFTQDNASPIREWYFNENNVDVNHLYEPDFIQHLKNMAKNRQTNYYGKTDTWLYQALTNFPIRGKSVLIIGSLMPWYESIALDFDCGSCTVVEYRKQDKPVPNVKYIQPHELGSLKFDVIFSISSYEHDGLGRYGDPLNPNADLESMQNIKNNTNPNGLLFLAVPVGKDEIVWNAHRVYGRVRLPQLINNWELVGKYGVTKEIWDTPYTNDCPAQPVFVLKNVQSI
jgi:hypothetical protein